MSRVNTLNRDGHGEDIHFEVTSRFAVVQSTGDARNGLGIVQMRLGDQVVRLDLDRAREIRDLMTECIEVTRSDELIVRFLIERFSMTMEQAEVALGRFREFRNPASDT